MNKLTIIYLILLILAFTVSLINKNYQAACAWVSNIVILISYIKLLREYDRLFECISKLTDLITSLFDKTNPPKS